MPATIRLTDLSPKFLNFYRAAGGVDPDTRFHLWKEKYHFMALPPTPDFEEKAREMLDAAFDRYPEVMPLIEAGAAGFRPAPQDALDAVSQLLRFDGDMEVRVTLYVGALEKNAFAYTLEGIPRVFLPLEDGGTPFMNVTEAHEFTHAVHERLSGARGGYGCSVGFVSLMEGLAIRSSQVVTSGYPETYYLEMEQDQGWLARCREKHAEILSGVQRHLHESGPEAQLRFTMGTGASGFHREAYYVGWTVVGHLLGHGWTLADLARVPEDDVPDLLDRTITEMLSQA